MYLSVSGHAVSDVVFNCQVLEVKHLDTALAQGPPMCSPGGHATREGAGCPHTVSSYFAATI
jgi:hypothetical protein